MRRKPTELKRISGTLRADRVNMREPRPPRDLPTLRRSTPAAAAVRKEHAYLLTLLECMPGVCTRADAAALELTAMAFAEYRANVAVVLERGATYEAKTESGTVMVRARPECALAADAWRRAHAALQTFGLSPSSRPKVEGEVVAEADGLAKFLRRRSPSAARFFGPGGLAGE